jgi:hypothetical protein
MIRFARILAMATSAQGGLARDAEPGATDAATAGLVAAAADAAGATGVSLLDAAVDGAPLTTEAGGRDGSEAGVLGGGAEAMAAEGTTTAVGAGASGVCRLQPVVARNASASIVSCPFAFMIDISIAHAHLQPSRSSAEP